MTYSYLQHANVYGGSYIDLCGRATTFDFNNFITTPEVPSKDVGSSYNFRLAEADYTGHANPKWIVEGIIPSGLTKNDEGSRIIDFKLLGSFCMLGSPSTFYDNEFMLNSAGSTWVLPQTFKVEKGEDRSARRYSLVLIETKQW